VTTRRHVGCAVFACVVFACAVLFACTDAPTIAVAGSATRACAPLDEPGAVVTSEGLTTDGRYVIVVTRTGGVRVFYGVASHQVEGIITGTHATCATEIDFDVEGRSEVAVFSPGPPQCTVASTLTSGNAGDAIVSEPLTVVVPAASGDAGVAGDAGDAGATPVPLSSFAFFCL
jgi:hypothetical protein